MLRVATPEQFDGPPRAPIGLCHAFRDDGSGETLCGLGLFGLFVFGDVDFSSPYLRHCPGCACLVDVLRE